MKTMISTLKSNQVTNFSQKFFFLSVIFCIGNSFSTKTLLSLEKTTYSSVHFAPLVFANSLEKIYLLFLPVAGTIPENTRILSGILNDYSKKHNPAGEKEVFLQKRPNEQKR